MKREKEGETEEERGRERENCSETTEYIVTHNAHNCFA